MHRGTRRTLTVGVQHRCTPTRHNFRISPESMLDRKGKVAENWPRRTKSEISPVPRRSPYTPMAATSLATLRSKIEADLRGRVASPFAYRDRNTFELVSTGI